MTIVKSTQLSRRHFFISAAALGCLATCEQRRVRLWLGDWKSTDMHLQSIVARGPTTYRDVAAERLVNSWKQGEPLRADGHHRAVDLVPGDAVARRRVRDGDFLDFEADVWVVCRVERLPA